MQRFFSRMPLAGRLILDTGMLIATIALIDPRASGLSVHEWVGIVLGAVLFVHITLNWQWVVAVTKKMFASLPRETRINQILNGLLFIFMAVAVGSGIAISEEALPSLGILTSGSRVWMNVHGLSANASLILVGAHVAMNWQWVMRTVRRIAGKTVRKNPSLRPAQARGGITVNLPTGA
jgi:cytochrome b561